MIHERGYWLSDEETKTHVHDEALCSAIIKTFPVLTAVDIGCGTGSYTRRLRKAGIDCMGYDGSPLTPELSGGLCKILDFSSPADIGKFDLVLSLEVGEHIPIQYEQIFIDNLCNASRKFICLSWAIIGQGGTGHVNCRDNYYVIGEMNKRGFIIDHMRTAFLRENSRISWFKNTVMTFKKQI
jgi:hypothetical protein